MVCRKPRHATRRRGCQPSTPLRKRTRSCRLLRWFRPGRPQRPRLSSPVKAMASAGTAASQARENLIETSFFPPDNPGRADPDAVVTENSHFCPSRRLLSFPHRFVSPDGRTAGGEWYVDPETTTGCRERRTAAGSPASQARRSPWPPRAAATSTTKHGTAFGPAQGQVTHPINRAVGHASRPRRRRPHRGSGSSAPGFSPVRLGGRIPVPGPRPGQQPPRHDRVLPPVRRCRAPCVY